MFKYLRASIGAGLVFVVVYMVLEFPLLNLIDSMSRVSQWTCLIGLLLGSVAAAVHTFRSSLRNSGKRG